MMVLYRLRYFYGKQLEFCTREWKKANHFVQKINILHLNFYGAFIIQYTYSAVQSNLKVGASVSAF